jgi:putative serine protease PepD
MSGVNSRQHLACVKPQVSQTRRHLPDRPMPAATRQQSLGNAGTMILRVIALAMFCAAVCAAVALLLHPPAPGNQSLVRSSERAVDFPVSFERVAAKVLPSIVTLQTYGQGQSDLGSGIILTSDGLIMTNDHVVAAVASLPPQPASAMVTFNDGRTVPFSVVAADPKSDIAIIRAEEISGLTPISFGSSAELRVGEPVAALGSPLGLDDTVTTGVISALNRPVSTTPDGNVSAVFDAVQTDAALNPGNSGGALVNMDGELIGMNAAMAMATSGGADDRGSTQFGSSGLGFAIPADSAKRIADELIATGTASHGWLGVQVDTDPNAHGARITAISDDSPAAISGLSVGALVTRIDGQMITSTDAFAAAVQSKAPGTRVTVEIVGPSGRQRTVEIILGSDASPRA